MEYFVISAKFVPLKYYTLSSQLRRLTSFSVGCSGRRILSPGQIAVMRKWSIDNNYTIGIGLSYLAIFMMKMSWLMNYIDDFNYMQTLVGSLMSLLYFINNQHCRGLVIEYRSFCPGYFVISYHHIEAINSTLVPTMRW